MAKQEAFAPAGGKAVVAPWVLRAFSLTCVLLIWEFYGRSFGNYLTFAPVSAVVTALVGLMGGREFWLSVGDTFATFVIGLTLALVVGIPLGLAMGRYTALGRYGLVYLMFLLALPMSALVPAITMAAGVGFAARMLTVFLFAVVETTLNAYTAVRQTDPRLVEMGRSFCGTERQLFREIFLPASTPGVLAGIRIGTGRALVGMVAAELLIISVGAGRLIKRYQQHFQAPELYAVVLFLLALGAVILHLVQRLERRVLRWQGGP